MAYRKLTADKLFNGYQFLSDQVLIIDDAGVVVDLVHTDNAGEGVERYKGILSPGFVNCHCHLELSHLKGKLPERTGLVDFVSAIVSQRGAPDEVIAAAIAEAEKEMKDAGIVVVGDICNTAATVSQKAKDNLTYHNFIEASGWLPSVSAERFARANQLRQQFQDLQQVNGPTSNLKLQSSSSIVPHAPYSVSKELWEAMKPLFTNQIVSIHNQETRCEDEFFEQGTGDILRMYQQMKLDNSHHLPTGRTSLQSYFHYLTGARNLLLVHNTLTTQADIDYIKQTVANQPPTSNHQPHTFFCLCPNANLFIEGVLPPVELFRKNDCSIVLGTDSLASNWSLSILNEIKAIQSGCPDISLEEMLRWATSNGAQALGMDGGLGSFEMGKKPGVVLMDETELVIRKIF